LIIKKYSGSQAGAQTLSAVLLAEKEKTAGRGKFQWNKKSGIFTIKIF